MQTLNNDSENTALNKNIQKFYNIFEQFPPSTLLSIWWWVFCKKINIQK